MPILRGKSRCSETTRGCLWHIMLTRGGSFEVALLVGRRHLAMFLFSWMVNETMTKKVLCLLWCFLRLSMNNFLSRSAFRRSLLCGTSQSVYEEWESYSCFIQITLIMVVANIALGLHPSISFFQPLVCFLDRHLLPMQLPASSQVVFYDKEWSILRFYFALETRCYSYAWVIPLVELWHLQEAVRLSTFMHWYQVLSMAKRAVVVFYTCHCVVSIVWAF